MCSGLTSTKVSLFSWITRLVGADTNASSSGRVGRGRVDAVRVDEHLDIELSDGRIVRLRGLDTPNGDHRAPEI
jgi:hypothetical protein